MLQRLSLLTRTLSPANSRTMATKDILSLWHTEANDSFHGKITPDGPFKPEKDRYHLYIGLFCPFAHRANLVLHLKQLDKYAGIETSIAKPYPKGDDNGWPGWQFNVKGEEPQYEGATADRLFGSKYVLSQLFQFVIH